MAGLVHHWATQIYDISRIQGKWLQCEQQTPANLVSVQVQHTRDDGAVL